MSYVNIVRGNGEPRERIHGLWKLPRSGPRMEGPGSCGRHQSRICLSMLCHLRTLLLVLSVLAKESLAQCYIDVDCGRSTVPASSYEECCDGTGSGVSYLDGDSCTACLLGKPFLDIPPLDLGVRRII